VLRPHEVLYMPGDLLHHVTNVGPGPTIGLCSRPWRSTHLRTVRRNRFRNATALERGSLEAHIATRCVDEEEYELLEEAARLREQVEREQAAGTGSAAAAPADSNTQTSRRPRTTPPLLFRCIVTTGVGARFLENTYDIL
jgi:hypothetical protein